jgi:hypothetical protein
MSFYLGDVRDYEVRSVRNAVRSGEITQTDADLIQRYISEKIACDRITRNRVLKLTTTLLGWRKNKLISSEYQALTTADLIPLASVIIIDSSGTQQIITDTLVVPSISFGRSVSDLIPTCSVSVPGAHDIVLSPPQTIAVEYQSVVRFHGVVTI